MIKSSPQQMISLELSRNEKCISSFFFVWSTIFKKLLYCFFFLQNDVWNKNFRKSNSGLVLRKKIDLFSTFHCSSIPLKCSFYDCFRFSHGDTDWMSFQSMFALYIILRYRREKIALKPKFISKCITNEISFIRKVCYIYDIIMVVGGDGLSFQFSPTYLIRATKELDVAGNANA